MKKMQRIAKSHGITKNNRGKIIILIQDFFMNIEKSLRNAKIFKNHIKKSQKFRKQLYDI